MDQALIEQIVKQVVDRLVERLIAAAPRQHVLMLFSGAGTGYVVGMQAIQGLAKAGHPLTVVMTASARHVIGEQHVRQAGAVHLVGDNEWVNTPKLVRQVDLVLLPTLSMNTAAHLALGLMDSLITTLSLGALLAGKPVLAIEDGADPFGNGGKVFGDQPDSAPQLRAKLAGNLAVLAGFGIQLVAEDAFLFSLVRLLNGAQPAAPLPASTPTQAAPGNGAMNGVVKPVFQVLPGMPLTVSDLTAFPARSTIRLAAGTRLTPLAQEAVYRQELTLVYE